MIAQKEWFVRVAAIHKSWQRRDREATLAKKWPPRNASDKEGTCRVSFRPLAS